MRTTHRSLAVALLAISIAGCGDDGTILVPTTAGGGLTSDETLHVDSADFAVDAQLFPHECVTQGTGGTVGEQIADMVLYNCYGEPVHLHDFCGRRRALWVIAAAGWCNACLAAMPEVVRIDRERRHGGLETLIVLGETDDRLEPTPEYCVAFAEEYGWDPARMVMDWTSERGGFSTTWSTIRPNGGDGGSIGLPWEVVLDPYDMTFYWDWANPETPGELFDAVEELLAN